MKTIYLCIVFCAMFGSSLLAQVEVNNTLDPSDTQLNATVSFFADYLNEFKPGRFPDFSRYWPAADISNYRIPDRMLFAINSEVPTYLLGKPTILFARPSGQLTHIKTMFSTTDSSGRLLVFSITNHYVASNSNGQHYLVNPMDLNRAWKTQSVRNIEYHFPAYHHFSRKKAAELTTQIIDLEKEWQLQPIPIRYYFADTKMEIEQYRGFDFTIAMGNRDKPSGISDGLDNIVYCGGWGENYFHEVVHIYLNRLFPGSPLLEGLAVMYGGSLGHDLDWHLLRLKNYLATHPEIDLEHPEDFYYLDNYTNPYYTILGLLCRDAYQHNGLPGLQEALRYPTLAELLVARYHAPKGTHNTLLRKMISAPETGRHKN